MCEFLILILLLLIGIFSGFGVGVRFGFLDPDQDENDLEETGIVKFRESFEQCTSFSGFILHCHVHLSSCALFLSGYPNPNRFHIEMFHFDVCRTSVRVCGWSDV